MAKIKRKTYLIDGDIIAYRIAFRAESEQLDLPDVWEEAQTLAQKWSRDALNCLHGDDAVVPDDNILVVFSSSDPKTPSYRYLHFPDYKGNRKDCDKPALLDDVKLALSEAFDTLDCPFLEGDDTLGLLATGIEIGGYEGAGPIVISIDKDLLQIPGLHYNPIREMGKIVTRSDALRTLAAQWIMGDSTDGFAGIPKMGPKKAEKFLADFDEDADFDTLAAAVRGLYKDKGLGEDYCETMFICAAILTADFPYPEKLPDSVRALFGMVAE